MDLKLEENFSNFTNQHQVYEDDNKNTLEERFCTWDNLCENRNHKFIETLKKSNIWKHLEAP